MITLIAIFIVLALLLVAFAIQKRDCVRASFRFRSIGFSLEAKNNQSKNPIGRS